MAVSNSPRPDVAVTFVSRHSRHRLIEVPGFLTQRSSGPHMDKVPTPVTDARRDTFARGRSTLR